MDKRIAIYVRVSTREQAGSGFGLDTQIEKCKEYSKLYEFDEKKFELYEDGGYSAKNLNRPAIKRLIKDVKENKIEKIIVYKLDRLSRKVVDVYQLISLFEKQNCTLIAVMDRLDISTSNGKMILGMLSVIAEWEQNVISERTIDGLKGKALKGEYPFSKVPFGWDRLDNGKLAVNENQANIIRDLSQLYVYDGLSIDELRIYLQMEYGIEKNWSFVKKTLLSKKNIGVFDYKGQEYKGVVPPILDQELYDEVIMKIKKREYNTPNIDKYIFYNKVVCTCNTLCNNVCTLAHRKKYDRLYLYYECPVCYKRVNQDKLFAQVVIPMGLHMNEIKLQEREKEIKEKLSVLERQIFELIKAYESDKISLDVYSFTLSELNASKKELLKQINFKQSEIRNLIYADRVEKRKMIKKHIVKISYDFEKMDIQKIFFKNEKK